MSYKKDMTPPMTIPATMQGIQRGAMMCKESALNSATTTLSVDREMHELERVLNQLDATSRELTTRLSAVLRPTGPEAECANEKIPVESCPLSERISGSVGAAWMIERRLRTLVDAIQV